MCISNETWLCKQSSHYEHILSLPKAYDLPLFWSEEERKRSLFGTTTYAETLALDDEVIQDYELLKHHLGEDFFREQNITMDRFKWVRATLWSRQCDLLRQAPETTRLRVLVPEFDMFNHSSKVPLGSSHKLNYSRGLVTAFATANVPKGEQAYISYGSGEASSSKLLLWYGLLKRPRKQVSLGWRYLFSGCQKWSARVFKIRARTRMSLGWKNLFWSC